MFDRVAGYGALPPLGFRPLGAKCISTVGLGSAFQGGRRILSRETLRLSRSQIRAARNARFREVLQRHSRFPPNGLKVEDGHQYCLSKQSPYAAAPLCWNRSRERGASLCARSMISNSRSGISLFITYSSTNQRIRPGISEYAESRMIGKLGNRCLIW